MKKTYKFFVLALSLSIMISFSGCSGNSTTSTNGTSVENNTTQSVKVADNDTGSSEKSVVSEEDGIEEVVSSGYEDVDEYLEEQWNYNGFQGVALIAEGDEIKFAKAYGYADEDDKIENTVNTRFAIASNTKQFTAAAIMQLVDEGKININDTIDKYFPKFKYASKITVKNLLQMRSGLVDYLNEPDLYMQDEESLAILNDYNDDAYFDSYVADSRWNSDIILDDLYLSELKFEPGTAYSYCNTNYYLLGLIVEQVSGVSYEEYIEKNIFEPCGMTNSSMNASDTDAKGHGSSESGEIVVNPDFTYAAGNIYTNVNDLLQWMRNLHSGNIVSAESYSQMITPADEEGYGFGLIIRDGIVRHSGVIDGFNSYTEYDPETDTTIILLQNYGPNTGVLDGKYDGSIIRGLMN